MQSQYEDLIKEFKSNGGRVKKPNPGKTTRPPKFWRGADQKAQASLTSRPITKDTI